MVSTGTRPITADEMVEGARIDMGDEGEGLILHRVGGNVWLESQVFKGWVPAQHLADQLQRNIDDEQESR